jgi:hypothetical protein
MRTPAVPGLAVVGVFEVFVLMPVIHGLTLVLILTIAGASTFALARRHERNSDSTIASDLAGLTANRNGLAGQVAALQTWFADDQESASDRGDAAADRAPGPLRSNPSVDRTPAIRSAQRCSQDRSLTRCSVS